MLAGLLDQPAWVVKRTNLLGGSAPYLALNAAIAEESPLISTITLASLAVLRAA